MSDRRTILLFGFITALLTRFLAKHETTMPEAFIYTAIACLIVGHWAFSAWLRVQSAPENVEYHELDHHVDELEKDIEDLKTKVNAIIMRDAVRR